MPRRPRGPALSAAVGSVASAREPWAADPISPQAQGRFRALGRLLLTAGERLVAAAGAAAAAAAAASATASSTAAAAAASVRPPAHTAFPCHDEADCTGPGCTVDPTRESVFLDCGTALRAAAEALLSGRWPEADRLFQTVQARCGSLFPEEPFAALRAMFAGAAASTAPNGVREALSQLGQSLEAAAENLDEAIQDALLDAAGALRSAARLFATAGPSKAAGARERPPESKPSVWSTPGPPPSVLNIERTLASTPPQERRALLKNLAREYHPDRNPGREMEVLPTFLYIQRLREEGRRWG